MERDMTHQKTDGQGKPSTLKKRSLRRFKPDAMQRVSRTVKGFRKRCNVGLLAGKSMTLEELHQKLSTFAHGQWEMLPHHASDWERGQVDGLFWALDKLDEVGEE